jgi:hypothetical protein
MCAVRVGGGSEGEALQKLRENTSKLQPHSRLPRRDLWSTSLKSKSVYALCTAAPAPLTSQTTAAFAPLQQLPLTNYHPCLAQKVNED